MKKRVIQIFSVLLITALLLCSVLGCSAEATTPSGDNSEKPYTEYQCDVKFFALSTSIDIDKEGNDFVKVKGNIFTYVTDPLTMYDMNDKKIAYAGDDYHLISQDSHVIFVDGNFSCEMVGLVDWFGESYDIYDKTQNKIAKVTFNYHNTSGQMYDSEYNLIADYSSNYLFNDFNIRIFDRCKLDVKTVLMIFCSYYSDYSYDVSQE